MNEHPFGRCGSRVVPTQPVKPTVHVAEPSTSTPHSSPFNNSRWVLLYIAFPHLRLRNVQHWISLPHHLNVFSPFYLSLIPRYILFSSLTQQFIITLIPSSGKLLNSLPASVHINLTCTHLKERFQDIYPILLPNSLDPVRELASQWAFLFSF